jgi:hypothetical protein
MQKTIHDAGWLSVDERADATKYVNAMVPRAGKQNAQEIEQNAQDINTIESTYKHNVVMDSFLKSLREKATLSFD